MSLILLFLLLAAGCQIILVLICLRGFLALVRWQAGTIDGPQDAIRAATNLQPPGSVAIILSAMFFAASLVVLSFPGFLSAELSDGLFFISAVGFGNFAMSAVVAMAVTGFGSKLVLGQLVVSLAGLTSLFTSYYLGA